MGFASGVFEFEHACVSVTKIGESGKDCKGVVAQKDILGGCGTCECVVTHASSFVFYSFRNWEPVELL